MQQFTQNRPEYWQGLIRKIRAVYRGKLTYAANWDEFSKTLFWGDLDFIGVDAYFLLSEEKTPSIEKLKAGWKAHKDVLVKLAKKEERAVLLTEYGYRSADFTAHKPWEADRTLTSVNLEGQANATKAILEEFWGEEWFAGGFVWKWFIDHPVSGGLEDNEFSPQNKPAENILRSYYKRY